MKREWVINIREQCQQAGVPFFFKQWGGVQKAKLGRLLDGRTWDEMPKVPRATVARPRGARVALEVVA